MPAHDNVFLLQAQEIGKQLLALIHAGKLAVIADVRTFFGDDKLGRILRQDPHREIQLDRIRLAAGHIQRPAHFLQLVVFLRNSLKLPAKLIL